MVVTTTVTIPRTRNQRTKTGCRTCKIRKVKCDETWPICARCQSTGRDCDGYGIWGGGGKAHGVLPDKANGHARKRSSDRHQDSSPVSPPRNVSLVTFKNEERMCFDWFVNRSTGKLYGAFFSNYWTTLLYQAVVAEPAIRHAVLALSSAHREEVLSSNSGRVVRSGDDGELALFTVNQYSTAIEKLEPCFSSGGRDSMHVLLISCALFVPMEFLRGNYTKGVLHLDHGLRLLHEMTTSRDDGDRSLAHVDGWLITILTRHIVQAKLLGQKFKTPCRSLLTPPLHTNIDTFRSIHHARRSLENIMLLVFSSQEQKHNTTITDDESRSSTDTLKTLHIQLQLWSKIADTTLQNLPPTHTFMDCFAYRLLRLYHDLTSILVNTSLHASTESSFDQCQPLFLNIVQQCIDIYKVVFAIARGVNHSECAGTGTDTGRLFMHYHNPHSASGQSVSDIGWIAPLYFTAVKCRNHRIRRQALLLLKSTPHKEGIWDAGLAAAVAEKVIEMEEGGFYEGLNVQESFDKLEVPSQRDLATPTLPVEFRVSGLQLVLPEGRGGSLLLTCSRVDVGGNVRRVGMVYDLLSGKWCDVAS